jgi:hypothetical protein
MREKLIAPNETNLRLPIYIGGWPLVVYKTLIFESPGPVRLFPAKPYGVKEDLGILVRSQGGTQFMCRLHPYCVIDIVWDEYVGWMFGDGKVFGQRIRNLCAVDLVYGGDKGFDMYRPRENENHC